MWHPPPTPVASPIAETALCPLVPAPRRWEAPHRKLMGEREGAGDRLPRLGPMGPVPRVIGGDGEGVGGATGGLADVALGATGWKGP